MPLAKNPLWQDAIHEMSRHLPPGGATLTVLVMGGGNIAPQMLAYRPDLHIIHLDKLAYIELHQLPIATGTIDAITTHNIFYGSTYLTAFLSEALRVLRPGGRLIILDPAAGRFLGQLRRDPGLIYSWLARRRYRFTLEEMSGILAQAGFVRVLAERVMDGYGILSRGEKPFTNLTTVERIAQTAGVDGVNDELRFVDAAELASASRGKFVFLLVRQTPDKPAWAIQPGEALRWQAAMVSDPQGQPYLLAFMSLSKAVEFMQAAVTANYLHGINKVAKFDKVVAPRWSADLLLNPPFEALHTSDRYAVKGVTLDVDPTSAVTGEE